MKKVGIVTFHRAINYGAMLQAVALQRAIKEAGEASELIDYVDKLYDHYRISYKTSNPIKSFAKFLLSGKRRKKIKRFETFLNRNADISQKRYTKKDIDCLNQDEYKLFVTGSDQVFNPQIVDFDETYLLGFVKDKNKCASYAASIGLSDLSEREQAWLRENIEQYRKVLIREKTGQEVLNQIGITDSGLVCDPTLLLTGETWTGMEHRVKIPSHYILCYGFGKNSHMDACADALSEKTGMPIYTISDALISQKLKRKTFRGIGPAEWLYLIHHADYIVTNSFHGMIFGFIYGRQVLVADSNDGTFSRMEDFLSEMGCLENVVEDRKDFQHIPEIDYALVNPRLDQYVARSKPFLQQLLEDKENVL